MVHRPSHQLLTLPVLACMQRALSHWNMDNWSRVNKTSFGDKVRMACGFACLKTAYFLYYSIN